MSQKQSQDRTEIMKEPEDTTSTFLVTPPKRERVGEYELLEEIGKGGMATVYKARHTGLDVIRAIKILDPAQSKETEEEGFFKRFEREAKIAAQLSHPNIITIHTVGQKEDVHYIDMDYVDGANLNFIKNQDGKIPLPVSLLIAIEMCKALHHAHNRKFTYAGESHRSIVHRDIKPANIMVSKTGHVKLTDFGIARAVEVPDVTVAGTMIGTVYYMSPEQLEEKPTDPRTDIYSLGVVLYEILTGQKPFGGRPITAVMRKIVSGDYKRIQEKDPGLPTEITSIVTRAMEMNPENRYQDIQEMQRDMEQALNGLFVISDPVEEIQRYLKDKDNYRPKVIEKRGKKPVAKGKIIQMAATAGLTIFIAFSLFHSMAGKKTTLTISSDLPGLQVTLDGRKLPPSKEQHIFIPGISRGNHTIEVKLTSRDISPIKRNITINSPQELVEVEFLPLIK